MIMTVCFYLSAASFLIHMTRDTYLRENQPPLARKRTEKTPPTKLKKIVAISDSTPIAALIRGRY